MGRYDLDENKFSSDGKNKILYENKYRIHVALSDNIISIEFAMVSDKIMREILTLWNMVVG